MRHGLVSTYRACGCRCDLCRSAQAASMEAWRSQARALGLVPNVHGRAGYANYGCRCQVCTEANKAACKAYHARRKAEAAVGEALATDTT